MKSLYLTAILPPEELTQQIDEIRKECAVRFNVKAALKPPVHITLYKPIKLEADREKELLQILQGIKRNHEPFKVELENFDTFNSTVVYIRVLKNQGLWNLEHEIKKAYKDRGIDTEEESSNKAYHPHITIAYRDIPRATFPVMWTAYKNKKFKRNFMASHFTLLKHNGEKWLPLQNFDLMKSEDLSLF
jgi:2'-5' RNA ligase